MGSVAGELRSDPVDPPPHAGPRATGNGDSAKRRRQIQGVAEHLSERTVKCVSEGADATTTEMAADRGRSSKEADADRG